MRRRLPPPPRPHLGHAAGGAGSRGTPGAWNGHTTALFATECQSVLDNVIAGFGQTGLWNDPQLPSFLAITARRLPLIMTKTRGAGNGSAAALEPKKKPRWAAGLSVPNKGETTGMEFP
jgi:hypothetical protein